MRYPMCGASNHEISVSVAQQLILKFKGFIMRCSSFVVWSLALLVAPGLLAEQMPSSAADAYTRATTEGKFVLLHFVESGAGLDSLLAANMLSEDPQGVRARWYVELRIVPPYDPSLLGKYKVEAFPTVVAARPDGTEVDRLVGRQPPAEITAMLKSAAEGAPLIRQLQEKAEKSTKVEDHGRLADGYGKRGRFNEALTEYLWCLEKGPTTDPSGYRHSLKLIVGRVKALENRIPSAKDTLLSCRQTAEERLSQAMPDSYATVFDFNEALGDSARNAGHFEKLPAASELRCELYPQVFESLVQARKYRAAVMTIDLETFIGRLYPLHVVTSDFPHGSDVQAQHTHRIAAEAKGRAITYTAAAVEACLGMGQIEKAKRLAGRLIEWSGNTDVRRRILEAAKRSGSGSTERFHEWLDSYVVESTNAN